jgi:hypothetical protein
MAKAKNWRKNTYKPQLTLLSQTKNACYFLIEDDVIPLRRKSWPISGLDENELANQRSR